MKSWSSDDFESSFRPHKIGFSVGFFCLFLLLWRVDKKKRQPEQHTIQLFPFPAKNKKTHKKEKDISRATVTLRMDS